MEIEKQKIIQNWIIVISIVLLLLVMGALLLFLYHRSEMLIINPLEFIKSSYGADEIYCHVIKDGRFIPIE